MLAVLPGFGDDAAKKHHRNRSFNWASFGKNLHNTRFADAETKLKPNNVDRLHPTIIFPNDQSPNPIGSITGSPAIVDDVIYFGTTGAFYAMGLNGRLLWQTDVAPNAVFNLTANVGDDLIYQGDASGNVYAFRKSDGVLTSGWPTNPKSVLNLPAQENGAISGATVLIKKTDDPSLTTDLLIVVLGGRIFSHTFYGSVIALDASTGAEVWRYNTSQAFVPPNEPPLTPNDGGPGVGIFGTPAVDTRLGYIFIGTGQNYFPPITPISDSLLAIDYKTGSLVWSHQFTSDDVSLCSELDCSTTPPTCTTGVHYKDWDASGGPYLLTIKEHGCKKDIVVVGTKQGVLYALERNPAENNSRLLWQTTLSAPTPIGQIVTGPNLTCLETPVLVTLAARGSANGGVNGFGCSDGKVVYIGSTYSSTGAPILNQFGITRSPLASLVSTTTISAVRAQDGKILWSQDFPGLMVSPMTIANGVVYSTLCLSTLSSDPNLPIGGVFRAQDAKTGKLLYEYIYNPFPSEFVVSNAAQGGPTVYKGKVYVGLGKTELNVGNPNLFVFGLKGARK